MKREWPELSSKASVINLEVKQNVEMSKVRPGF